MISTLQDAYGLCEQRLSTSLPRRWAHVQGVLSRVSVIGSIFAEDDFRVLRMSAVLHDIGYSSEVSATRFHALDGAIYLQDLGAERRVCALVAHHSCAYREAAMRGLSGAMSAWVDEGTPVRDALWWADMTTTPDGETTDVDSRINEIQQRYGRDDLVSRFIRQAKSELVAAVERTEERLRAAGLGHLAK